MKTYDVVATRREKLRDVIKTRFAGKQTLFVDETGINAGELSGLLRDRHFGEKKARSLETALKLPRLWLDGLADAREPDSTITDFNWTYNHVSDEGKVFLKAAIDAAKAAFIDNKEEARKEA